VRRNADVVANYTLSALSPDAASYALENAPSTATMQAHQNEGIAAAAGAATTNAEGGGPAIPGATTAAAAAAPIDTAVDGASRFELPLAEIARIHAAVTKLGARVSDIVDFIPIRLNIAHLAAGPRPQSYRSRWIFRVNRSATVVRRALTTLLPTRPLMRAIIAVPPQAAYPRLWMSAEEHARESVWPAHPPSGASLVVMESTPWLFDNIIIDRTVANVEAAMEVTREDSARAHAYPFALRAELITLQDTPACTIFCMTYSHCVMDAMTLFYLHSDVNRLIHAPRGEPAPRLVPLTPYSQFVDILRMGANSRASEEAVEFHIARLRGISRHADALWPPQKAAGWMVGSDDGVSKECAEDRAHWRKIVWEGRWVEAKPSASSSSSSSLAPMVEKLRRSSASLVQKTSSSAEASSSRASSMKKETTKPTLAEAFRYPRSSRVVTLPDADELRTTRSIAPVHLARAALALFNVRTTGAPCAIYTTWEGGREWPFIPPWLHDNLPPAYSIDGPAVDPVVNMTFVDQCATVEKFLRQIIGEAARLEHHAHAPLDRVLDGMREEAGLVVNAARRQGIVWDVSLGLGRGGKGEMETMARYDWPDW
jgi:hypothetical protein